ncbi:glycosyltransferase family 4 protein [Flavihumibacter sp. RY-1]|uniref:Glycosyltransferase family 4 protein n=1 Tax=Flavihumibacter fluminis TaxID=2909236 RepID=A0ABS9BN12_9BACT|nr:glycosyltransferase family 4 protein [Flavihumibacter fluminis]MCF1716378.1 glycosyltransferase family 4 protein [Flavihumibacter fluminis]
MKRIVFVNQATGYLTIDIINDYCNYYDEVVLIAGSIRVQDIPLDKKVKWQRICLYNRGTPVKKFISWLWGSIQILFLLLLKYRKHEIFYFTIPPFSYLSSLILKRKFSILVYDIYPDVLTIYGISSKNIIYRIWSKWNKIVFNKAFRVFTISEDMKRALSKYIDDSRIYFIPLWSGLHNITPINKEDNSWLNRFDFSEKFIVQYSGNIGYTHNVEIITTIARCLLHEIDVHFLIIGRGERFNAIQQIIIEGNLTNVTLLPFQPDDVLNLSLAASDLSVVIQDEKVASGSLPSKIFNIQAVGNPVLGISSESSSLNEHLAKYDIGKCFHKDQVNEIVSFILELKNNKSNHNQLKENSKIASTYFTSKNATLYYSS